jgi:prepilin-type N-terminal cleavage/methylation domain-containing protein
VNPRAARSESGFTLVELLIAMAILGMGMLTVALAQVSALRMTSKARSLSQAMYLAQEQLDTFMALPGGNVLFTTAAADVADPLGPLDINANDEDQTTFTRRWTVEPDQPSVGLTRITINVGWDTPSGLSHEIELQGIKRRG